MAGGLVPVVPSYGGCSEIVPSEYQYSTLEDATDCDINGYNSGVHNIAKHYSPSGFRELVQRYIEQACSNLI
jgi:hypothetical protein